MYKLKLDTETICKVFNECGSVARTAEILGRDLRSIQRRIKKDCKYQLTERDG